MSIDPVAVQFTGDSAPFFKELQKVRDELGGLRGEASKVGDAFRSVGNLIKGYIGFRAVTGTIRAVVQATAEAEAAQAQLNNALAAAGAEVKAASAEYQAYASKLQKTTTFSDEAIMQVETLLLSFRGLSGQVVKDATLAVLDLSTRMGIDAPAAAKLLGKALSDPEKGLTALTRAGVTFTDAQKDQIKALTDTGRAAEAQAIILESLETRFGGAANAARDTFGGALAGLKNAFGDLLEGGSGINAASGAINSLTNVLSSPQVKTAFQQLVGFLAKSIELTAKLAAGLAIVFTGQGGNESVDIDLQIERLEKQRKALEREQLVGTRDEGLFIPGAAPSEQLAGEIAKLDEQIAKLRDRQQQILGLGQYGPGGAKQPPAPAPSTALDFTTGGEDEGPTEAAKKAAEELAKIQEQINDAAFKASEQLRSQIQAQSDAEIRAFEDTELRKLELFGESLEAQQRMREQAAAYEVQAQADAEQAILSLRQGAVNSAIGLLQFLAQRSKAAAVALILVNKALSIQQAVQNTATAVTKAMAYYGPTPQGFAAAASAKALGAIQIGLIAATGALEAGAVFGGGGSSVVGPGTPNNPIFTRDEDGSGPYGVTSQRVLQLHFNGDMYGFSDFRRVLVDAIKEEVNDLDTVIINSNSRQALELRDT